VYGFRERHVRKEVYMYDVGPKAISAIGQQNVLSTIIRARAELHYFVSEGTIFTGQMT